MKNNWKAIKDSYVENTEVPSVPAIFVGEKKPKKRSARRDNSLHAFIKGNDADTRAYSRKRERKPLAKKKRYERQTCGGSMPVFCNRLKICVDGYNQNRLINSFLKEKITVVALEKVSNKRMDVVIDSKNKKKAFALMDKLCYNHKVVQESGFAPVSKWLLYRIGIFISAVIFTVVAAMSGSYVWKIDIEGNDRVDDLMIIRQLESVGVGVGTRKNFDVFSAVEAVNGMDGISECSVSVVGTTVKVTVMESKEYVRPSGEKAFGDIVSLYDTEITRLIGVRGAVKVRIGDRVPKGGVLISNEVFDVNGEVVGQTAAEGIVYGKVFFSESAIISTSEEKSVRTGRSYRTNSLTMFDLGFSGKKEHGFLQFETETVESYAFKNLFLPIKLRQITYYETEREITEIPIDEAIEKYTKEKVLELIIKAGGSKISTTVVTEEISAGLFDVRLYVEAELPVGIFCPI